MKKLIVFIFAFTPFFLFASDKLGDDVRLYRATPVWKMAKAIKHNDTAKLRKLLTGKSKEIIDYCETEYGMSLLNWAIYIEKLDCVKILAEMGADPNLPDYEDLTPLIAAANIYETSEYLKVLLKHGGDPNYIAGKFSRTNRK